MTSNEKELDVIGYVPKYPDVKLYANINLNMVIWEADNWKEALKTRAYRYIPR